MRIKIKIFSLAYIGACGLAMCFSAMADGAASEQEFYELVYQSLSQQISDIQTLQIQYVSTEVRTDEKARKYGMPGPVRRSDNTYLRSGGKAKSHADERIYPAENAAEGNAKVWRSETNIYDGTDYITYLHHEKQGGISAHQGRIENYYELCYFVPQGDVAAFMATEKENLREIRKQVIDGRETIYLKFVKDTAIYEIFCDAGRNYLPYKIEKHGIVPQEVSAATGSLNTLLSSSILEFKPVGDYFVPARADFVYKVETREGWETDLIRHIALKSVKMNEPVDDEEFKFKFPEGASVTYYDLGVTVDASSANTHLMRDEQGQNNKQKGGEALKGAQAEKVQPNAAVPVEQEDSSAPKAPKNYSSARILYVGAGLVVLILGVVIYRLKKER